MGLQLGSPSWRKTSPGHIGGPATLGITHGDEGTLPIEKPQVDVGTQSGGEQRLTVEIRPGQVQAVQVVSILTVDDSYGTVGRQRFDV
jgi:hypothetical protein